MPAVRYYGALSRLEVMDLRYAMKILYDESRRHVSGSDIRLEDAGAIIGSFIDQATIVEAHPRTGTRGVRTYTRRR